METLVAIATKVLKQQQLKNIILNLFCNFIFLIVSVELILNMFCKFSLSVAMTTNQNERSGQILHLW